MKQVDKLIEGDEQKLLKTFENHMKERMERKIETDEILKAFFSIRKGSVRKVAIEQVKALAKL